MFLTIQVFHLDFLFQLWQRIWRWSNSLALVRYGIDQSEEYLVLLEDELLKLLFAHLNIPLCSVNFLHVLQTDFEFDLRLVFEGTYLLFIDRPALLYEGGAQSNLDFG